MDGDGDYTLLMYESERRSPMTREVSGSSLCPRVWVLLAASELECTGISHDFFCMSKFAPHRRPTNQPRPTSSTICQKCLKPGKSFQPQSIFHSVLSILKRTGHFIYECKSTRPYISRPTRTQQLENPRVLAKLKSEGKPSVDVPEEFLKK
jgi:hypothetical protein